MMKRPPTRLLPTFIAELDALQRFYFNEGGATVAKSFTLAVEKTVSHIADFPFSCAIYEPPKGYETLARFAFRKAQVSNFSPFPYTIFYVAGAKFTDIHAVYHQSQHHEHLLSHP